MEGVVKEGLSDKATSESRPKGTEGGKSYRSLGGLQTY